MHWLSSFGLFIGTWLSGYFIIVTDAWMQHPVGYRIAPNGMVELTIDPPVRAYVAGLPITLRTLWVSVTDPDALIAAVAASA